MSFSPELHGQGEGEFGEWHYSAEVIQKQIADKAFGQLKDFYAKIDAEFEDLGWDMPGKIKRRKSIPYRDLFINKPAYGNVSGYSKLLESSLGSLLMSRNTLWENGIIDGVKKPLRKDTFLTILASEAGSYPVRYLRMYAQRVFDSGQPIAHELYFTEGERQNSAYGTDHHERTATLSAQLARDGNFNLSISGETNLLEGNLAHFVGVVKRNLRYDLITERHTQSE